MTRSAVLAITLAFLLSGVEGTFATRAQAQPYADSTATPPDSSAKSAPSGSGAAAISAPDVASQLREAGLENLAVERTPEALRVRYENRHFRHTAEALGAIHRVSREPVVAFEERYGLTAAAIVDSNGIRVLYPTDRDFPRPPGGQVQAPTRHTVDLLLDPLFSYSLGGILDEVMTRWQLQTELRYNPWPGARIRASMIFPVHSTFTFDDPDHPDIDRVRPGPVLVEQFAWVPRTALVSGTAGMLGDNRYGVSFGAARPLWNGSFLLDLQSDFTGYLAYQDSGYVYSAPNHWTGFADVVYRPPGLDLGVRLRAGRFLHGDHGFELEMRRAMGDLDVALFAQRIQGQTLGGIRLGIPIPPMVRPVGWPVRVLPVDRWGFEYREESLPVGETVKNVASREEFLRQLDRPALQANRYRERATEAGVRRRSQDADPQWTALTGMTGFINTPWAGVMRDREFEFGYNKIPKAAAYDRRGINPNEVYYGALGFLPHIEAGLRWTVIPGYHTFQYIVPESPYTDADRMFSGRLEIVPPRDRRPGLAIGIDDAHGTRRFHDTYAVAGMPFDIYRLQNRVTIGYAPRVFTASRRTLDGLFGAYQVTARRTVAAALEYDTEKWNTMLGINLGFGLRARVALLDLEHLSFGAGWFRAL
jgi:exopolysaccharide biosynthesis protein YbjH